MHLCAQEDRVSVAEELVKENAATDPKTKAGYTPLHVACHFGSNSLIVLFSSILHELHCCEPCRTSQYGTFLNGAWRPGFS